MILLLVQFPRDVTVLIVVEEFLLHLVELLVKREKLIGLIYNLIWTDFVHPFIPLDHLQNILLVADSRLLLFILR